MLVAEGVALDNHRLQIKIALTPMPRPSKDGTYLKFWKRKGKAATQPKIHLEFEREGKVFDKRGWGSVISGAATLTLVDGTVLDEDDLDIIDDKGWEILSKYGLYPTEWVGPNPTPRQDAIQTYQPTQS